MTVENGLAMKKKEEEEEEDEEEEEKEDVIKGNGKVDSTLNGSALHNGHSSGVENGVASSSRQSSTDVKGSSPRKKEEEEEQQEAGGGQVEGEVEVSCIPLKPNS